MNWQRLTTSATNETRVFNIRQLFLDSLGSVQWKAWWWLEGVETCSPVIVDHNKTVVFWLPFYILYFNTKPISLAGHNLRVIIESPWTQVPLSDLLFYTTVRLLLSALTKKNKSRIFIYCSHPACVTSIMFTQILFVGKSQMSCNLRGLRFWVVGSNYALVVNYILFSLSSIAMCR
jgi:hypothetical protein